MRIHLISGKKKGTRKKEQNHCEVNGHTYMVHVLVCRYCGKEMPKYNPYEYKEKNDDVKTN